MIIIEFGKQMAQNEKRHEKRLFVIPAYVYVNIQKWQC